jgi:putative nucleotidyltransferase with HDIG domain
MLRRVKQFLRAITARIKDDDQVFVRQELTPAEQVLFWRMSIPDQRHALNVAYTALQLACRQPQVNKQQLITAALLHDVGKEKGDISTWDKVITVLTHRLAPDWAKRWARFGRGSKLANLRHAFYIYYNHAARSAELLHSVGTDPYVIDLVSKHHKAPASNDSLELMLLRQADGKN